MSSHDQLKSEEVNVQEICHLSDQVQAELIADSFSKISNQYNPINTAEICLQPENEKPAPVIEDN